MSLKLRRGQLIWLVEAASQRRIVVTELREGTRGLAAAVLLGLAALSGGCAGGGSSHAVALPAGTTCGSIKSQLSRLDARGVRSSIEAQSAGQRLSAGQKADADAYNSLLNDYLKARCHEMQH